MCPSHLDEDGAGALAPEGLPLASQTASSGEGVSKRNASAAEGAIGKISLSGVGCVGCCPAQQ